MHRVTVIVLDGVMSVVDDAVQTFVHVGNVIAAIEIVIDEHLPIALDSVGAALEKLKLSELEGPYALDQAAEKDVEAGQGRVEVHPDELFPRLHPSLHEAVLALLEVGDTVKIRYAFQRAVEPISPAVVGTAEVQRHALSLPGHSGGVMPAHVEESAQNTIRTTNYENGLAG